MLERYIRDVGVPRTVVVVHTFDVWGRAYNPDAIAQVPLPFGFWSELRPPLVLSAAEQGRVLLDRYVPLYSQDQTISRLLRSPRRTLSRSFDMDDSGFYHSARALPDEVKRDFKAHLEILHEDKEEEPLSRENRQALEAFGEMGARHGFDVIVAHAPLYEGLWDEPLFRKSHARLDADLERAASSQAARARPVGSAP
jgi:hypothetical protein